MMELSAVLFDRDGPLIEDRHYLGSPEGVELVPGTGEALAILRQRGVKSFVVSNQSGIGRGYFPESGWHACEERLGELLSVFGAGLDDERFCPHGPDAGCSCRKPGTGMWESLRVAHSLDPERCVMVGDKVEDLLFGANAGLFAAVLVLSGKGERSAMKLGLDPVRIRKAGFCRADCSLPEAGKKVTRLFAAADVLAAVEGLLAWNDDANIRGGYA